MSQESEAPKTKVAEAPNEKVTETPFDGEVNSGADLEALKDQPIEIRRTKTPRGLTDGQFAYLVCKHSYGYDRVNTVDEVLEVKGYSEQQACRDATAAQDIPEWCRKSTSFGDHNPAFEGGYADEKCKIQLRNHPSPTLRNYASFHPRKMHASFKKYFRQNEADIRACMASDRAACLLIADDRGPLECRIYGFALAHPSLYGNGGRETPYSAVGAAKAACEDEIEILGLPG